MSLPHWSYVAMLAFCLAGTLPLVAVFGLGCCASPAPRPDHPAGRGRRSSSGTSAPPGAGHWWFDPDQTLPWRVAGLPLEEVAFFVVIPLAAVLTYEAVQGRAATRSAAPRRRESDDLHALAVLAVAGGRRSSTGGWPRTRLTSTRDWWSAYAIIVVFQLLTNGWLTGRGIVRYDADAILGNERVAARRRRPPRSTPRSRTSASASPSC